MIEFYNFQRSVVNVVARVVMLKRVIKLSIKPNQKSPSVRIFIQLKTKKFRAAQRCWLDTATLQITIITLIMPHYGPGQARVSTSKNKSDTATNSIIMLPRSIRQSSHNDAL